MKTIERQRIARGKQRIERRLARPAEVFSPRPVLGRGNRRYEISGKQRGIVHGGIGTFLQLSQQIGLAEKIDAQVHVLKLHLPYHESDHVLNIAFNALCEGTALDDIELRRNDAVFLDALGADRIPDPTTAGDFCRRFTEEKVFDLLLAIDQARLEVWKRQPHGFFDEAVIDVDGHVLETSGRCKQGMEYSYKGVWGYHPLLVSLANTREVLAVYNRPGNRPSHEEADDFLDGAIDLVRQAGFRRLLLRGDTDFTQTHKLDDWDDQPNLRFVFGMDASPTLKAQAEQLPESAWSPLERRAKPPRAGAPRQRPADVKAQLVKQHQFDNLRLVSEQVAEFAYRPGRCRRAYRIVVVRKNLSMERGDHVLFDDLRYFFYITNDRQTPVAGIVFLANDRCEQENLLEQLQNGVRALAAPLNTLVANWAYMVMMALAWNLKAWWALWLPVAPGRWQDQHQAEKQTVLRMEFKTFAQAFLRLPCLIVKTGRRLIFRLLSWNPWQHVFYRMARVLRE